MMEKALIILSIFFTASTKTLVDGRAIEPNPDVPKDLRKETVDMINKQLKEKIATLKKSELSDEQIKDIVASYLFFVAKQYGAVGELEKRFEENESSPWLHPTTTTEATTSAVDNIEDIIAAALELAEEEEETATSRPFRNRYRTTKKPNHEDIIFNGINKIFDNVGDGNIIGAVNESIKFASPNNAIAVANGVANSVLCIALSPFDTSNCSQ